MRLKLIKLAGFKSFVEPTRIELNADMTAVVGPNGCGKSNVIDAVRWVLGESSARHLRGENMTDVIFNGSVNRSAHGRASVELVFDNPHNRVPGEFGRFTEISVRREVLRDGSNHYQINGQKCRRKDVTDLFLGTGLGPRSYAIIEQGTVSRLVESRPADLKLFMEEAAGVSRYKERRRETEQRIRHTQENLERLGDIRGELGSRLDHLKAQAETAERYKQLKSRSRAARAELIGSELWTLETRLGEAKTELAQTEQALAALDAKRTADEGRHVTLSVARQEAQAEQASRQQQIFLGGQAIARLEQQQLHQSELGRDWQARRQALGERIEGLKAQLASQLEQLSESTLQGEVASARLEQCEQLLTDQQSVRAAAAERLEQARQRQQQWQQQLGQLQGRLNQTRAEVNGLQELQAKTRLARLKLEDEQAGPLGGEGENLQPALDALAAELALSRARHEESEAAWQAAVARHEALKTAQGHQQGSLRELEARLATLDQILGEQMAGATLADRLQVPPEWARGLDKVLGRWLTATPADECNLTQSGLWIGPAQPAVAAPWRRSWAASTSLPSSMPSGWWIVGRRHWPASRAWRPVSRCSLLRATGLVPTGRIWGRAWPSVPWRCSASVSGCTPSRAQAERRCAGSMSSLPPPTRRGPSCTAPMSWLSAPCASRSSSGSNCAKPGACVRGNGRSGCSASASWGKS